MGYLNNQLEKVASAVTDGMEKKASKLLSVLGKAGRGIGKGIRGVGNHVGRHLGKYALGGGLAGWGTYNYVNTGKIDPETGLPVLARDRSYAQDTFDLIDGSLSAPMYNTISADSPDAEEHRLYAAAFEDYKKKRGYYENMPWYQKILPFAVGEPKRINQEFYHHSGNFMPREILTRNMINGDDVYLGEKRPSNLRVSSDIARMSPEERAALDDPKVAAAVQASIDTQRPFARLNSPWRDKYGFEQWELRPDPLRPGYSGDVYSKHDNYYEDAYPRIESRYSDAIRTNPRYNPSKYGLNR